MKKVAIRMTVVTVFILIIILGSFLLDKSYKSKAEVVISNDYSQMTYNNNLYVLYLEWEENGVDVTQFSNTIKNVIVEKRFFLWDMFLTDYIHVSIDEEFIYLETDYDLLESNYYKIKE